MLDWLQAPGGFLSRPIYLYWGGGTTATTTPDQPETEECHDCSSVDELGPCMKMSKFLSLFCAALKTKSEKEPQPLNDVLFITIIIRHCLRCLKYRVIHRQAR